MSKVVLLDNQLECTFLTKGKGKRRRDMSRRTVLAVMVAVVVLASGFVGVTDSSGFMPYRGYGKAPIDWEVAGTIVIVQLPMTQAGPVPGFLIDAFVKGAPGRARFRVVSVGQGAPIYIPDCGEDVQQTPNGQYFAYNDMVITFEDQSMLFAKMDSAFSSWSCFTGKPAVANMKITGGTGKYESAEGYFQGIFDTPFFGDSGALLAETGTIKGWIDK